MQKLGRRNTYTPTDTSLVRSNCGSVLNSLAKDSVQNLKTCSNNSEENQLQQHSGGTVQLQRKVYVLNFVGKPLMPTSCRNARKLLEGGKVKVTKRFPFTIQLLQDSTGYKQPITLGIDSGYKYIGVSAVTEQKELFSAEVELRNFALKNDIVKLLSEKKTYRKLRRSRLWYREPRFLNRGIPKGWLAPSIKHKLNSHLRIVEEVYKILPITKVIVEVANFDIQKIKNPMIQGKEYQEGEQKGFWNTREYILHRDDHTCQYCHGKDKILNIHHLKSRQTGGSSPDNLITLCENCHQDYHDGKIVLSTQKVKGFKEETFMSIVRWKIVDSLREKYNDVNCTYGYLTKSRRIELGLEKNHHNDAFCIANGNSQSRTYCYDIFQKRKNNRCLQRNKKSYGISIRRKRYKIQPHDLVIIDNKEYVSKGTSTYGQQCTIIKDNKRRSLLIGKIKKVFNVKTLVWNNDN